jgi:type IV pilus assembly protein PilE
MQRRNQGFTLIDLMITITIMGILAAIAYPSYNSFVIKAREQNARADLVLNINKLERYYAKNKTFIFIPQNTDSTDPTDNSKQNTHTLEQKNSATYFTFSGTYKPSSYRLVATPTPANSGATRVVVYDSLHGMLLCDDIRQESCDPF